MRGSKRQPVVAWVLGAVLLFALAGLIYTPYAPSAQIAREAALSGPSASHWLGVDALGRDLFSRLWRGTGNTVVMALGAVAGSLLLSSLLLAGEELGPRWLGRGIALLVNLWVAIPVFFVGLLLLIALSASPGVLVLAAALGNVPLAYRQLRVLWRGQQAALHVESSRVLGAGPWEVFIFALWPGLWPDLLALVRLVFALAALELSGLAFLGLIGNPDFPELGTILRQHLGDVHRAPSLVLWPGLCLSALLALVHAAGPLPKASRRG